MRPEADALWPIDRAREALDALILQSGIPLASGVRPQARPVDGDRGLGWLKRFPPIGCDVRSRRLPMRDILRELAVQRGACLVCDEASSRVLAVNFETAGRARFIRPDGHDRAVRRSAVLELLSSLHVGETVADLFAGLPGGAKAAGAILDEELDARDAVLVTIEPDAAHPLTRQLAYGGAFRALAVHLALTVLQTFLGGAALWTLGSAAVDGHVDRGRLLAWTILALSLAPLQYVSARALGGFSTQLGARIKRRLLEGTFRIDEREIRRQGFGALLGRANEASIVERVDVLSVFDAITSVAQLGIGAWIVTRSSERLALIGLILGGAASYLVLAYRVFRLQVATYGSRLEQTNDLVGKILGHRTRAVQQPAAQYHGDEDANLFAYGALSSARDSMATILAMFPRGWLTAAAAVILAGFLSRDDPGSLVVAALGCAFVYQSFAGFGQAILSAASWFTAYRGVQPLLGAGATRDRPPRRAESEVEQRSVPVVLSAASLSFAYRKGGLPVLSEASLRVHRGEKVLLTGPSGGGKTTLFKLIGSELRADAGVILVSGADAHLVSEEEWRERVASAPQFHENYIFSQPAGFNLDPRGDLASASREAEEICAELGLDDVITRMPQGYAQLLGETGWQLSHGERSRFFIARALLQGAELFLFDESFGALDPETQLRALDCVKKRARTLLVIAHV